MRKLLQWFKYTPYGSELLQFFKKGDMVLLVMCLLPNFGSGMFDSVQNPGNGWNGGIIIEGDTDIPPEVLEDLLGQYLTRTVNEEEVF